MVVVNTNDSGVGSLRDIIAGAIPGDTVIFDSSLSGQTITLTSGDITINKDLNIDGSALANQVSLSGNNNSRIFLINTGATVALTALNFIDGNTNNGGAINIPDANTSVTIDNSRFANNNSTSAGGAIRVSFDGSLTVNSSLFESNSSDFDASAIFIIGGALTMANTTVTGGSSPNNREAITIQGAGGSATIVNSTIVNNLSLIHI